LRAIPGRHFYLPLTSFILTYFESFCPDHDRSPFLAMIETELPCGAQLPQLTNYRRAGPSKRSFP
jgi:hypothetical protein